LDSLMRVYGTFALLGIVSAVTTLILVLYNPDWYQHVWVNVMVGALALFGMIVISKKMRRLKVG
jgi:FtsH-binding integral membrane protein